MDFEVTLDFSTTIHDNKIGHLRYMVISNCIFTFTKSNSFCDVLVFSICKKPFPK